jgi:signal transduction histidine kinase
VDAVSSKGIVCIVTQVVPFEQLRSGTDYRSRDHAHQSASVSEPSARVRAWMASVGDPELVVKVVVADSGPGVPWNDRERVFDPFFTTKEPGKGTGLGLAVVSRIVESVGGAVWVRDAREGGAAFTLLFPVAVRHAAVAMSVPLEVSA